MVAQRQSQAPLEAVILRAVTYGRVSSEKQEDEQTIDAQVQDMDAFVATGPYVHVETYLDEGYTGKTLKRPALDRLRDDAARKLFDVVVITKPDRLSRDRIDPHIVRRELARHGVTVVYLSGDNDDTPEGKMLLGMKELFGEYERGEIAERMRRGRRRVVEDGKQWASYPAYGYDYLPRKTGAVGPEWGYRVNEGERPHVRTIFLLAASGVSYADIARELNVQGVPTKHGKKWERASVNRMVSNPLYKGWPTAYRWEGCEAQNPRKDYYKGTGKSSRRLRPVEDHYTLPQRRDDLAIVSDEEWEAAQYEPRKNKSRRNLQEEYLLHGKVECGCAHAGRHSMYCMTTKSKSATSERVWRMYKCKPNVEQGVTCTMKVRAQVLEDLVWMHLRTLLLNPESVLTPEVVEVTREATEALDRRSGEIETVTVAAEKAQRAWDKVKKAALLADDAAEEEQYERLAAQLRDEYLALEQRRLDLSGSVAALEAKAGDWSAVEAFCAPVRARLDDLSFAQRQAVVAALVERVTVYPDGLVVVDGEFGGASGTLDLALTAGAASPSFTEPSSRWACPKTASPFPFQLVARVPVTALERGRKSRAA